MTKMFLGKEFEFGGTLKNLDEKKGNYHGIYIIVRPSDFQKIQINSVAKLQIWRGKPVAKPVAELQKKLAKLNNADIMYLGKSEGENLTNRKRVMQHVKFWGGKAVSARGGKVIGQIESWEQLEAWYLKCDNPTQMEHELLREFKKYHNETLPFANWKE